MGDLLHHELRLYDSITLLISQRVGPLPFLNLFDPLPSFLQVHPIRQGLQNLVQLCQDFLGIAYHGDVHPYVLADDGRVDIDVNDQRPGGESLDISRHPIIKPRPHGQYEIAVGDRHIGVPGTMHPQHPQTEWRIAGKGAQSKQGGRDRGIDLLRKLDQLFGGPRVDHSPPGIDDRPFRFYNRLGRLEDLPLMAIVGRIVAANMDIVRVIEVGLGEDHILGHIHQNRPGTTRRRDMECLLDGYRQILDIFDQVIMLGAGPRDPNDIGFLEGVISNHGGGNLSGNDHHRDRIHIGGCHSGHHIGRPWTGGHQTHPHFSAGPGIAIGRVGGRLLVPNQYMLQRGIEKHVIDGENDAPGESKDGLHPFPEQALDDDSCTRQFHMGSLCRIAQSRTFKTAPVLAEVTNLEYLASQPSVTLGRGGFHFARRS